MILYSPFTVYKGVGQPEELRTAAAALFAA